MDIEEIIESHEKGFRTTADEVYQRNPICQGCLHAWPCDSLVLIEEIKRLRQEVESLETDLHMANCETC